MTDTPATPTTAHGPGDGCGELLWEHMRADPSFDEELRQAEAELAEGRGVPFKSIEVIPPVSGDALLIEWMRQIVASGKVAPRGVAGHEWPARCWDCGFTTEDPDAYAGDDEELMEPERLCPQTSTFHRWVPTGTVRYLPEDFLQALAATAPERSGLPDVERLLATTEERLRAARFVAEYWRDEYLTALKRDPNGSWGIGTHPLALVLAALDGETDPRQLGLPERKDEEFRAALTPEEGQA